MDEPEGFAEFVAARRTGLFRVAVLLTGDRQLAEDLVQATFVRVWTRWRTVSRVEDVDAYVRRVLMSVFLTWRRKRSWHERPSPVLPTAAGPDTAPAAEDRIVLVNALRRLPPRQRSVIALRYLLDASEAETAAAMNCSVGTVKRQAHRALGTLRTLLAEDGIRIPTPTEDR